MATEQERNRGAGAYSGAGAPVAPDKGPSPIITSAPIVSFKLQQVDPPGAQYIGQDDRLEVTAANSDSNITQILINGRILRAMDGKISPFNYTLNIGTTRAVTSGFFDMAEGYLLDLECLGNGGTIRGRCFIQARIVRGAGSNVTEYSQLISDNFSRAHNPKWPGGEFVASIEGPGAILSLPQGNPAAGTDFSITVPTGARWSFRSLNVRFITAAAVANRIAEMVIQDAAGNVLQRFVPGAVQAASLSVNYSLQNGGIFNAIDATQVVMPCGAPLTLFAGWKIASSTNAIQAADQFGPINLSVEEWIEL